MAKRSKTHSLYDRARKRIPGGTQLLSKRPEQFAPGAWPAYFREARGCHVWDLDGNRYIDMSHNGVGSCLLGYAHPKVSEAVKACVDSGSMCSLNPPEEVELADRLCELHPWADCARFTRGGGEACAVAVRIARATTGRSAVAFCGYHGWHDWYLAANLGAGNALDGHLLPGLKPDGVPEELRGASFTFSFNDQSAFDRVLDTHGSRLAAVIMEPCRYADPEPGFLQHVCGRTRDAGAVLIFDEITIGWRRRLGGSHLGLGTRPDMAVFAKALGNGHPIGAVIGTESAMEGAHTSFISSTYWTERVGPVAALATLDAMREVDVPAHVHEIGARVQTLWATAAEEFGIPISVHPGYPCLPHFAFVGEGANALRTLFSRLMLDEGFLAGTAFYPTLAHGNNEIAAYGEALGRVFPALRQAADSATVADLLQGPAAQTGFGRLL